MRGPSLVIALVAHHSVVHGLPALRRHSVAIDLTSAGVLCWHVRASGVSWAAIVAPRDGRGAPLRGVPLGLLTALPVVAGLGAATRVTVLRAHADLRVATAGPDVVRVPARELLRMLAIGIPLGVVLPEELCFRGVLLASDSRHARALSNAGFGLWHAVPAWRAIRRSRRHVLHTVLAMAATAAIGVVLCELRERGGLSASIVFHTLIDVTAMGASWSVLEQAR